MSLAYSPDDEFIAIITSDDLSDKRVVSITEAAKLNNVTRQAIYVAIKQNKLRATKKTRWEIDIQDLDDYRTNKYSRNKSIYDGEPLYNNEQGYYSVNQIARMLEVPTQKIYYATRSGMLRAIRKGIAWVIHIEDARAYRDSYLDKRTIRRKAI
jgi:predicted DNA-binding protein YlxM (UPF0122 family)